MLIDSFHAALTALEFDTFCNDYGIGSEFGPELPVTLSEIFLRGRLMIHISQFSVLGASHVNASVAPIATRWFFGKKFPQDSAVNDVDGDMALETLLNDNPTRIRRYPKEFLEMRLQDLIKVPNPFDVVCAEKNLAENERPILEQTIDVVTQPSNHIADDTLSIHLSDDPSPVVALKARKFINCVSIAALKRLAVNGKKPTTPRKLLSKKGQLVICRPKSGMREFAAGSSHEAADDLCSSEAGSKQLVSKGSSKTFIYLSSTSTNFEPLVSARLGPPSFPVSHHILGIIFDLVEDSAKTPREDLFYASMSVDLFVAKDIYHPNWEMTNDFIMDKGPLCRNFHADPTRSKLERRLVRRDSDLEKRDAEIVCLHKLLNEKPSGKMARLSLGFEGAEREKKTDMSTLNGKYQDLLQEKEQLELHNASLWGQVDSDLLGSHLGACIFAAISDKMRQGLEAGFVHGKKGTNINYIPTYNPNAVKVYADALSALNDVSFPLLEHIEACVDQLFSYLEALLVMGVHDLVESDEVLAGTTPHDNVVATLAYGLNVLNFDPATLAIPTSSIFE
ncbi:hypothetical protein Tco_0309673 [Tanacetum coccineum]